MNIFFRCRSEGLQIYLNTDTKPTIGDTVLVSNKKYIVTHVIWCLEEPPAQSGLLIDIIPASEVEI